MTILVSTTWFGSSQTDLRAALDPLRGLDIDGIELGSTHAWRDGYADLIRQANLGCVFVHNFFPPARDNLIINLASNDREIRDRSIVHAKECLRFSAEIGAALYTVHPGFLAEPLAKAESKDRVFDFQYDADFAVHEEAYIRMIDALSTLCEEARRLGVRLAVETQGSVSKPSVSLLERAEEYDRLFQDIPSGLDLNFNLAHSLFAMRHHGWDMESFIERHRYRFAAVELSHNDGTGDQHAGLVAGSFALDWARRLSELPLILEFRDVDRTTLEQSVALVRAALPVSS